MDILSLRFVLIKNSYSHNFRVRETFLKFVKVHILISFCSKYVSAIWCAVHVFVCQ